MVRRLHARRRSSSCSRPAPTRRCRWARCAPTGSCWSCGPTTCASRRRRRTSSSTAGSGSSSPPPTSSCSSRGPRAGPPASTWRRCRWRARRTRPALVRAFDGTSAHVVDFLSSEVLGAYEPELQAFMLRTSVLERLCAPLCDAVLGGRRLGRRARVAGALEPVPARRSTTSAAGSASTTSSPSSCASSWSGASPRLVPALHRRAFEWHDASGTTDEAIHHAVAAHAFAEAGALIAETWVHYVNAGRTSSVLDWLLRFPEAILDGDARLLLVQAWVSALRGSEDDMRARARRGCAARRAGRRARCPDGFASLESSLCVLSAAFAWGDVAAIARGRRAVGRARGAGVAVAPGGHAGRSAGATTATATSTVAERWLRETAALAPAADQWIVGTGAIADLSLIAGHARRPRRAAAPRHRGRRAGARARAARGARGRRGAHGATASRSPRTAAARRRCPRSSRACSCAACGASRSTSPTG